MLKKNSAPSKKKLNMHQFKILNKFIIYILYCIYILDTVLLLHVCDNNLNTINPYVYKNFPRSNNNYTFFIWKSAFSSIYWKRLSSDSQYSPCSTTKCPQSGTGCDPTPTRSLTPTPTPNPHHAVQHWTTYLTHLSGLIHTDLSPSLNFWFNSVQAGGAESGSGSAPTHRLLVLQHCRICSSHRICSYSVYTVTCVLQRTLNSASYKAEWQVVSSVLLLVEDALYVGEAY